MNFHHLLLAADRLPYSLRAAPYHLGYWQSKLLLEGVRFGYPRIWHRNSLRFGNITPGISDIDFTFYYPGTVSHEAIAQLVPSFRLLKKALPLMGEFNLYCGEDVRLFLPHANPVELTRDPMLVETLKYRVPRATLTDKAVFLLRMLEADAENLTARFALRRRKWALHLQKCGIESGPETLRSADNLIDAIAHSVFRPAGIKAAAGFIREHFFEKRRQFGDAYAEPATRKPLLCLLPHRWIGFALAHREFKADLDRVRAFSVTEARVFLQQLSWEIWGLSSQYRVGEKNVFFARHGQSLVEAALAVRSPSLLNRVTEVRGGLAQLVERYQRWHGLA